MIAYPFFSQEDLAPVVLIGMHRSGTSLLSRLLISCGVYMGADLSENAESLLFQQMNRKTLVAAGARWDRVEPFLEKLSSTCFLSRETLRLREILFEEKALITFFNTRKNQPRPDLRLDPGVWGWKDPRNTLTLPLWLSIFLKAKVIHVIRNGVDVAISLHIRERKRRPQDIDYSSRCLDFAACFQLWEQYIKAGLQHARFVPPDRYTQVRYEDLLQNQSGELSRILEFAGLNTDSDHIDVSMKLVKPQRLDNRDRRTQYEDKIRYLIQHPLMIRLGYG